MKNYHLTIYSNTTGFSKDIYSDNASTIRKRINGEENKYCKSIDVYSQKHDEYIYENNCGNVKNNKLFEFQSDLRKIEN